MSESSGSASKKMLTQYQKALKRAERERQRIMREHQMELERKKKQEKKELKSREKQAKKEEEERIKEEKRQRRLEEQRKRDEEKEAERKRKEEEKRKKDEERLQKEQERKREEDFKIKQEEKQRAVLLGFLVKGGQKKEVTSSLPLPSGPFMQFQLRKDMRMAPLHRVASDDLELKRSNLDSLFQNFASAESDAHSASSLGLMKFGRTSYLHELRTGQHTPLTCQSTWPTEPPNAQLLSDGLCSIVNWPTLKYHGSRGSGGTVWLRAKLFQFVENYRPAYYGTWRRRSRVVTGRRPFARDHANLDYTIDSDDEWEEEEPGESITQSENEEEEEKEEEEDDEDEDEDDQFLVPHGYLSDDEGVAAEDAGEEDAGNEEMKTLRRRLSAVEYEVAHRRGLQRLKPTVSGPVWLPDPVEYGPFPFCAPEVDADKENVENASMQDPDALDRMSGQTIRSNLGVYRVHLWETNVPIPIRLDTAPTPAGRRAKKELPEDALPYLIHLVHKSPLGKPKLAFEFRVFWHQHTTGTMPECTQYMEYKRHTAAASNAGAQRCGAILAGPAWDDLALSQYLILAKIVEIAVFEEGRWAVHPEVIRRFGTRLATITGIEELFRLGTSTDDEVSSIVFPPWRYLTDVVAITKKGSRPSASKRRSLEVPVSAESESPQLSTTISSANPIQTDSLRVLIEPLKSADKSNTCTPVTAVESQRTVLAIRQSTPLDVPKTPDCAEATEVSKIERDPTQNGTPVNRKRVTLDTFFTPPTKRQHTARDGKPGPCDGIRVDLP